MSCGLQLRDPLDLGSNCFRYHLDRTARAFLGANTAALAIVQVELETVTRPKLDYCIIGTNAVAVVALKTVSAGEATARLIERVALVKTLDDFLEC